MVSNISITWCDVSSLSKSVSYTHLDVYKRQILDGPEDSLFEDASFVLTLKFPQDYPNHPPDVKFVTKVFHPNICKILCFH